MFDFNSQIGDPWGKDILRENHRATLAITRPKDAKRSFSDTQDPIAVTQHLDLNRYSNLCLDTIEGSSLGDFEKLPNGFYKSTSTKILEWVTKPIPKWTGILALTSTVFFVQLILGRWNTIVFWGMIASLFVLFAEIVENKDQ